MIGYLLIPVFFAVTIAGIPLDDSIIYKLDQIRFHYIQDANGQPFLANLWVKASNLLESTKYNASDDNIYYLYTADNSTESQLIVLNDEDGLAETNYNATKRTIVLIHGWNNNAKSDFNIVLRQAFLGAEDVNVIVVDWSAGAKTINYASAVSNTGSSGEGIAEVLNWLVNTTGGSFDKFHLVGHSIGAHAAGVAGRNLEFPAAYISALDPALPGFVDNENCFLPNDGNYTEVIHTNAGIAGYSDTLGDVDFYPNGGTFMPGCIVASCDHSRSYNYMAESVSTGGFTAFACESRADASIRDCDSEETLNMGGLKSKPGRTGIFYLETNADSPFSQG